MAWNLSYSTLFADPAVLLPEQRNGIWIQLMRSEVRDRMVGWEHESELAIGRLRAAAAKYPGDPHFQRVIGDLMESSEFFRMVWTRQEVHSFSGHLETVEHPQVGTVRARLIQLRALDRPHFILMVHQLDDEISRSRMTELLLASCTQSTD
jgi:hypothetical protein